MWSDDIFQEKKGSPSHPKLERSVGATTAWSMTKWVSFDGIGKRLLIFSFRCFPSAPEGHLCYLQGGIPTIHYLGQHKKKTGHYVKKNNNNNPWIVSQYVQELGLSFEPKLIGSIENTWLIQILLVEIKAEIKAVPKYDIGKGWKKERERLKKRRKKLTTTGKHGTMY